MKKTEIIELLKENDVKSINLRTFLRKKKAYQELNFSKILGWLEKIEAEQERKNVLDTQKGKAKIFKMSFKQYVKLQEKAKEILNDFETGYSMGEWKYLNINKIIFLSVDNTQEYAKSYKLAKALHGQLSLNFKKSELISIEKIDGVWQCPNGKKIVSSGRKNHFKIELK